MLLKSFKERKKVKSLSHVQLFATPWTVAYLPGSSIHGIFQARVLEWVTTFFSRGYSDPGTEDPWSPALQEGALPSELLGKPHLGKSFKSQLNLFLEVFGSIRMYQFRSPFLFPTVSKINSLSFSHTISLTHIHTLILVKKLSITCHKILTFKSEETKR